MMVIPCSWEALSITTVLSSYGPLLSPKPRNGPVRSISRNKNRHSAHPYLIFTAGEGRINHCNCYSFLWSSWFCF